jgi:hypothetical protein
MGRKVKNIKGQKFDSLLVIDEGYRDGKNLYWKLQCDCGEICYATSTDLNRGRRNFCKKCNEKKSYLTALNCLYGNYIRGAKKRELEFELSLEEFENLINQNCNYCGIPPKQIYTKKGLKSEVMYNGIDREDNLIGYTIKNSIPCCKHCNFAKRESSMKEFLEWLKYLKGNK